MLTNIQNSWRAVWRTGNIWESSDHPIVRVIKTVYFIVAFLIGSWLVPLRDAFQRRADRPAARNIPFTDSPLWSIPVTVCNGVPNAVTVAIRGVCGSVGGILFLIALWTHSSIWFFGPVGWFWFMVAMFCTDFIDGPLARQLGHVTKFGREADPTVDKIVSGILAIGLAVLAFKFYGPGIPVLLVLALIHLIWVEQDVARISIRTRKLSEELNIDMHGAFGAGKIKFTLEAAALGAGFAWYVWEPSSIAGVCVAITLIFLARPYADKSREHHRNEELQFRKELAMRFDNVIELPVEDVA